MSNVGNETLATSPTKTGVIRTIYRRPASAGMPGRVLAWELAE